MYKPDSETEAYVEGYTDGINGHLASPAHRANSAYTKGYMDGLQDYRTGYANTRVNPNTEDEF